LKNVSLAFMQPGKLDMVERRINPPGPREVLVRIKACGICAGDVYKFKRPDPAWKYPVFFGHEGCGVVEAVGKQVTQLSEGDNVALLGKQQFSQRIVVPVRSACKLPSSITHHEWIVEPVACVVNSLTNAGITPGDDVVIVGCGFMGLLHVQGLAHMPVSKVVAVERIRKRLSLAGEFGATHLIARGEEEELHGMAATIAGFDVAIECSGAAAALNLCSKILRRGGTLVIFAWHHQPRRVDTSRWHVGGYRVLNTSPMFSPNFDSFFGRAVKMMERGIFRLDRLVTHVSPAERAQELFEIAASAKDGYIKGAIAF